MNLRKVFLSILVLSTLQLQPMDFKNNIASKTLKTFEYFEVFSTKVIPTITVIYVLIRLINHYSKINKYTDINESSMKWCKNILSKYQIKDIEKINFKISKDQNSRWSADTNKTIYLSQQILSQLYLKENLEFNEFSLLHEINHLENNDVLKRAIYIPFFFLTAFYLIKKLDKIFLDRFNLNENLNFNKTILKSIFIYLKMVIFNIFYSTFYTQYMRYQENKADDFAIKHLNDLKKIEGITAAFYMHHNHLLEQFRMVAEEPCEFANLNFIQKSRLDLAITIIKFVYSKTNNQNQSFKDWLNSNPRWFKILHWIIDPSHPTSYDRAYKLEQRKLALTSS